VLCGASEKKVFRAFFATKKWLWFAYGGGLLLLLLLYAQVSMSVRMNAWYGGFYDILQHIDQHTFGEFKQKLIDFSWIAVPWTIFAVITNYVTRRYSLWWREAITFGYLPRWRRVSAKIEGESQRLQEDAYRFARIVETLGLQVARAVMTLFAFLPILWILSKKGIAIPLVGTTVGQFAWFFFLILIAFRLTYRAVSWLKTRHSVFQSQISNIGYFLATAIIWLSAGFINRSLESLVWVAVFISFSGTVISWFVGIKLPGLEYNNQVVEAAFRKELVLAEEDKANHGSIPAIGELFTGIKFNYKRLFWNYGYFDLWSNLFNQVMVIIPFLIAGPALFSGIITLGVLIQIDNAFGKVQGSFALFMENWTTVTELRSIKKRLKEFEENLDRNQPQSAATP